MVTVYVKLTGLKIEYKIPVLDHKGQNEEMIPRVASIDTFKPRW